MYFLVNTHSTFAVQEMAWRGRICWTTPDGNEAEIFQMPGTKVGANLEPSRALDPSE